MSSQIEHRRVLGVKDMTMFSVSAILLLDTLAAGAAAGTSAVGWWVLLGLVFFIPYALICCEMGTAWPEQGGIYAWIRRAYGRRWASRAAWAYWVNVAVWFPAISILFAGILSQLLNLQLSLGAQIGIGIAMTWIAVGVNTISLDAGKWIPNLGAIFKLVVIGVIIVGAIGYVGEHGMANELTWASAMPVWDGGLQYITVIIYGMLGFELVSAGSEEMRQPQRDVPRAIFASGLIIIVMYVLATVAILAAVPVADIDLVEGLMDTLYLFLGNSEAGRIAALVLGFAALYTFFSNGVTWSMGANRAAAEAANEGELPAMLGWEHPRLGTPVGAAIATGIVSTVVLVVYGLLVESNADLFWALFAFSAVIFLLPYVGMTLAFVRLRTLEPQHPRPFRVSGGNALAGLLGYGCASILVLAIVLFVYVPGEGMQWPVFAGAVVVLVVGEVLIRQAERQQPR